MANALASPQGPAGQAQGVPILPVAVSDIGSAPPYAPGEPPPSPAPNGGAATPKGPQVPALTLEQPDAPS